MDPNSHAITWPSPPRRDRGSLWRHDWASESPHGRWRGCARLPRQDAPTDARAREAGLGRLVHAIGRVHTRRRPLRMGLPYLTPLRKGRLIGIPAYQTSGVILWFLALISSHPEVQARAHEELDNVVGRDFWPTAEDEHRLPYIRAIIKEVSCEIRQSHFWAPPSHTRLSLLRWSALTRHSGWRRHTIRPMTLYTMGCTSRRTRPSY